MCVTLDVKIYQQSCRLLCACFPCCKCSYSKFSCGHSPLWCLRSSILGGMKWLVRWKLALIWPKELKVLATLNIFVDLDYEVYLKTFCLDHSRCMVLVLHMPQNEINSSLCGTVLGDQSFGEVSCQWLPSSNPNLNCVSIVSYCRM